MQIERIIALVCLLSREEPLANHRLLLEQGADFRRFLFLSPDFIVDHKGRAYRDTEVYAELLDTGFDVLIITLGTNDAKANDEYTYWHDEATWVAEYVAMLDDIVATVPGVTAIYVGTPAPIYGDGNYAEEFAYSRDIVHDTLQRLARDVVADLSARVDFYVGLVDFFEALGGDDPIDDDYKDAARTPGPTFSQTRRPTTS